MLKESSPIMLVPFTTDAVYNWDIVCMVAENCLFKVPRQPLAACSEMFAITFGLQCGVWSLETSDGCSTDKPILLPDSVSADELRSLLKLAIPSLTTTTEVSLSKQEWLDVLKLSTLWSFNDFRRLAINRLDTLLESSDEQIELAMQYHISAWLVAGYVSLINQNSPIDSLQAKRIGERVTVDLYIIRHSKPSRCGCYRSPHPFNCNTAIEKAFADDLSSMREHELRYLTKAERQAEEERRASATREERLAQMKANIEAGKQDLKDEEAEIERQRVALREAERRLADGILDEPVVPAARKKSKKGKKQPESARH